MRTFTQEFLALGFCLGLSFSTATAADEEKPSSTPGIQPITKNKQAPKSLAATNISFVTMDTMDDKHKLALGDKLTFRIVEDQEDPNEKMEPKPMMLGDRGEVEVPYIGPFPAVGKTCKQLAREIKTELEKKYYYQATVLISLELLSKTTGKVYVMGEVRLTGPVDMPGDESLTVGKAIVRAGGFTNYSDKRRVKVTRSGTSSITKTETIIVNVADVLEKGKTDKDLTLESGDVIYVPSRLINF
jgi:protein involved in polysaccharide export with SLBB domain